MATKDRCKSTMIRNTARRIVGSTYDCGHGQVHAYDREAQHIGTHQDEQAARKAVWDAHKAKGGK